MGPVECRSVKENGMGDEGADKSKAAAKVAEAAANIKKTSGAGTEAVARRYFDAIAARDVEAAVALWAPGGREHVRGQVDVTAPEGVREFIGGLIGAMPDMRMEVVETTSEGERTRSPTAWASRARSA
jgi:hypothetical protein